MADLAEGFGTSLIKVGLESAVTPTSGGANGTFNVQEPGFLEKLVIPDVADSATSTTPNAQTLLPPGLRTMLREFKVAGVDLISGVVAANLFSPKSRKNPYIGVPIDPTRKPQIRLSSGAAAAAPCRASLTCGSGRSRLWAPIIAIGPDGPVTLNASTPAPLTMVITRACILGRLWANRAWTNDNGGNVLPLQATRIVVDGDEVLNATAGINIQELTEENDNAPWSGLRVKRGSVVQIQMAAAAAAPDDVTDFIAGFTTVNPYDERVTDGDREWLAANQ